MKNARGFTLVELLVAITVLAIVAVMGWRGLDSIVRSREQLTQNMEQTRGIQLTFAQLQSDLEQIADRSLLRQRQNLLADNGRLVFIRTVLAENAASQLQVVTYQIREGVLSRRESAVTRDLVQLDGLWQAAIGDAGAPAVALQAGVNGMEVRVWEAGGWKAPQNSSTSLSCVPGAGGAGGGSGSGGEGGEGSGVGVGGPGSGTGSGGTGNPCTTSGGGPMMSKGSAADGPTGLEILLQIQGQPAPLAKVFLLGAV